MVSTAPAGTPVTANNLQQGGEMLCTAVDCAGVEPAVMAATVLAATTFLLLALATFVHVSEGVTLVNAERRRTRAERDAFRRFASRVEELDASAARMGQVHRGQATLVSTSTEDPRLGKAREAYRETVMAVSHFDEEYDESLAANMAAEFGEGVATAVVAGSRLTPELKRELVRRSGEAADHRATLLRTLAGEIRSLEDAREELEAIEERLDRLDDCRYREHSYDALVERWDRIQALDADCQALLDERQRSLRDGSPDGRHRGDGLSFYDYVYRPLTVSFPVLADGLALAERIRIAERSLVDALTTRV